MKCASEDRRGEGNQGRGVRGVGVGGFEGGSDDKEEQEGVMREEGGFEE